MKLLYLVLVVCSAPSQISTYDFEDTESRNYLGVFTVVKFANDACQGLVGLYLKCSDNLNFQAATLPGSDSAWRTRIVTCREDTVTKL